MSSSEVPGRTPRSASIPVLRAFGSQRFRLVLAVFVALIGVAVNLLRLTLWDPSDPGVAFDFAAYYHAAERMLAGASPYTTTQLEGVGVAYCLDCYLYPPFLAQVLSPITLVPLEIAKVLWLAISFAAALLGTWLATGIGGATRSLECAVWCLAAVLLFEPVGSSAWVGNVGTIVALGVTMVAMGGGAAGVGAATVSLLKVAPATLVPAVFAADRTSRTALVATLAVVTGILFLLAPQAWLEYPVMLRNVFAQPSGSDENLAFVHVVSMWDWGSDAIALVRVATLGAAGACVLVSVRVARRRGGMPAAALFGTVAMLVVPGTIWLHYLAVLLPLAAMAWPRSSAACRGTLLAGMVMVNLAPYLAETPALIYLGSALLLTTAGWVLWPRQSGIHVAERPLQPVGG